MGIPFGVHKELGVPFPGNPANMRRKARRGGTRLIGRILRFFSPQKKTMQIHTTHIGYGLYVGHGGPIIINSTARLGDNCTLSPFTVIGSNHKNAAVIGDNVYIGPGVCIVEGVKIGNNVTIGAGSVVTKDIPDNATAVGNYAKVIHYDNPGRYVGNRWGIEKQKEENPGE